MIIEVNQCVKRYKEVLALDHFDFTVKEGEIVGLLGPNGSGKTTLINCILALLKYDQGEIKLFGQEMRPDAWDIKARIGVVPQELALMENLTVRENIDYFCGLYVDDKKRRKGLIEEAIHVTGLAGYEKFYPRKLSGGLKRRLNIACGIAHKPELLFLDEPTVAVDAQSRNFILEQVQKMNAEGTTVVYTTHYLEEAQQICSRIIIMDKGKNLVSGSTEELLSSIETSEKIHLSLQHNSEAFREGISQLPQLLEYSEDKDPGSGETRYTLKFAKSNNNLLHLLHYIQEQGLEYTQLYSERPTLNDVFLELTGKELRD